MFLYTIVWLFTILIVRILYLKKTWMFCSWKWMKHYNQWYYHESINECNKSLKNNPKNKFAHYYKWMSLIRLNKVDEWLIHLNKFIEDEPKNIDALMAKHSVLFHLWVKNKSKQSLNESLELWKYIIELDDTWLLHNSINQTINEINQIKVNLKQ